MRDSLVVTGILAGLLAASWSVGLNVVLPTGVSPAMAQEMPPSLPGLLQPPKNPAPLVKALPPIKSSAVKAVKPVEAQSASPVSPVQTRQAAEAPSTASETVTVYRAPVGAEPSDSVAQSPLGNLKQLQTDILNPVAEPNAVKPPSVRETPDTVQASVPVQGPLDILRSVPLEIDGYDEAKAFPACFSTSAQVLQAMDSSSNLLIHMEVLRRAYHQLPDAERDKLLTTLLVRQRAAQNDMRIAFDHGYAQLVFEHNKTGLFFLRKANDKLQSQFSSMAYGMAEAEADIILEDASPDAMTTRKMDAAYKLSDAVKMDAEEHQPGFWPSYIRVIEKLKPMKAYDSFTRRDFSLAYVPYGNTVVPMRGATSISLPLKTAGTQTTESDVASSSLDGAALSDVLGGYASVSCDPGSAGEEGEVPGGSPASQKRVSFGAESALLQYFNTDEPGLYRVRVTAADGHPMLSFRTYASGSIVEDLEGDGTFEIVARQYAQNPLLPVLVYRYTPCGFELDKKLFNSFR